MEYISCLDYSRLTIITFLCIDLPNFLRGMISNRNIISHVNLSTERKLLSFYNNFSLNPNDCTKTNDCIEYSNTKATEMKSMIKWSVCFEAGQNTYSRIYTRIMYSVNNVLYLNYSLCDFDRKT